MLTITFEQKESGEVYVDASPECWNAKELTRAHLLAAVAFLTAEDPPDSRPPLVPGETFVQLLARVRKTKC